MRHTPARARLAASIALAAAMLAAGVAGAQAPAASPHGNLDAGVGDVPAGAGVIRGRVTHRGDGRAAGEVPIRLFALASDGRPGLRDRHTGADGSFRFEGVSTDPGNVYLVVVQRGEIPFAARVAFEPGETERTAAIEIAEPSADGGAIEIAAVRLRLDRGCSGVRVTETHVLRNPTDRVLYVPLGEREAARAIYATTLPEPQANPDSASPGRGMPEGSLEQRGAEIGYWGPLHPGEHTIEFSYSVAAAEGVVSLERRFDRAAESAAVLAFESAPAVSGPELVRDGTREVDGRNYAVSRRAALAAGEPLALRWDVRDAETEAARLDVRDATLWLELDDAALDAREQYVFEVAGDAPLQAASDAPLLCLPLPRGAESLRFSTEAFAMGIEPGAEGGLALRGPVPAGGSGFALSYLLPNDGGGVRLERDFGVHLSRLSVFVADTGVLAQTDRLHRRRPARTSDRTFIHLEGFEIEAGEPVVLDLRALAPPQPLPRSAAAGFVAVSALVSVLVLIAPLRGPRRAAAATDAEAEARRGEREAVYAAIRDLEDDFDTGKIAAEDHAEMLAELRASAADLVRLERAERAPAAAAAAPEPVAACAQCGSPLGAEARFCSQCGAPVKAPPGPPDAGA